MTKGLVFFQGLHQSRSTSKGKIIAALTGERDIHTKVMFPYLKRQSCQPHIWRTNKDYYIYSIQWHVGGLSRTFSLCLDLYLFFKEDCILFDRRRISPKALYSSRGLIRLDQLRSFDRVSGYTLKLQFNGLSKRIAFPLFSNFLKGDCTLFGRLPDMTKCLVLFQGPHQSWSASCCSFDRGEGYTLKLQFVWPFPCSQTPVGGIAHSLAEAYLGFAQAFSLPFHNDLHGLLLISHNWDEQCFKLSFFFSFRILLLCPIIFLKSILELLLFLCNIVWFKLLSLGSFSAFTKENVCLRKEGSRWRVSRLKKTHKFFFLSVFH
jgi:hypothetical protein